MSRALVIKSHRRFSDGQDSLEEQEGRGRKKRYGPTIVTSIRDVLVAVGHLKHEKNLVAFLSTFWHPCS